MKNQSTHSLPGKPVSFSHEEVLSIILNNLREIFILVDRQLHIVHITENTRQAVRDHFGVNITSSTSVLEFVSPGRRPFLSELYKEVLAGKERETVTQVIKNGQPAIFETHFRPARNAQGEIVGAVVSSRDITEKKTAENILKETEERWRFALQGGHQGVWDWNVQTGDIFFSDSYKKLYGYEQAELKGRIEEWVNMIHPDDRSRLDQAVDEHIASTDPYHESTYRLRARDGNYRWVLGRGMLIRNEEGLPVRMIGTHTDITRQVTAEQTYKVLFYSNPLPMWTYDLATLKFLSVNDAAIEHYGYSKDEFLRMTLKDIRPPECVPGFLERVSKRKEVIYLRRTSRHLKKSGEVIDVELTTHRMGNSEGTTVLVVAQDITAKIRAEEELKKSNERYVLASRATSDAIYDWDIVTNEIHWGEGLQTLFGFHRKEMPVALWESLLHPEDRERILQSINFSLQHAKKKFWKEEYRFSKADGSFRYVLDRGFILRDEHQKAVRMIGSMQDITERKYAEQVLSLERTVFELSNQPGVEFRSLAETLLRGIEDIHKETFTSLLLLRGDGTMEPFLAPRLPEGYSKKLDRVPIGPDAGSCGVSMWRKETVIVEDIATDPLWTKYRDLAMEYGLRSCWSLPIVNTSGQVMGSFAVYTREPKRPTSVELNTLVRVRNILRILMEHQLSVNEIKKAKERFDIIMKATHDLIWDWNLETNIIYRDPLGLQKVYGIADNKSIETIEQWLTRIHPEDVSRVQQVVTDILQSTREDTFDVEYRFRKENGDYSHVYDRGMILRNGEGLPVRMIGAAQEITERKNLEEELLRNELEKQKAINQATVDSQEQQRTEIGKELHDNVNQILTTTKLYLDLALSNAELRNELIEKSSRNVITVINEIRQLSRSLMDPTIGDLGLMESIQDLIENINLTRKLQVSLVAEHCIERFLQKNHKLTIFRIIQEALNNAIKYAKATKVVISFRLHEQKIDFMIKDDGIGFDPASVKMGAGLKNIQNRVYLVDGTYRIKTAPGRGCTIKISFPITKKHEAE